MLPGVLQSWGAWHDGRVQGGEGNSLNDEDNDNGDCDDDSGKPLLSL